MCKAKYSMDVLRTIAESDSDFSDSEFDASDLKMENEVRDTVKDEKEGAPTLITVKINVGDENDNTPEFTEKFMTAKVSVGTRSGVPFMKLHAIDLDDQTTLNGDLRYSIIQQNPETTDSHVFFLDPNSGSMSLTENGK
ncbi:CAD16 protein, partial [Polypterus senegalus]